MLTRTRLAVATAAVVCLALSAAGPASALDSDRGTVDRAPSGGRLLDQPPIGTKSCTVEVTEPDGRKTTRSYPPGSKIKLNGKEYECQDGTWVPTAPVDSIGLDLDYVYEAGGGYYAVP